MEFILQRYSDSHGSSLGIFLEQVGRRLDFQFYCLEDQAQIRKIPGRTRIPAGRYRLALHKELTPLTSRYRERFGSDPAQPSDWFSWHVEILEVPGFSNVYIHIGNDADDTDGCLLVGDGANNNRVEAGFISNSVRAYRRWYGVIEPYLNADNDAWLTVRDESALLANV